eukprot:GHVT01048939.1.p1 GENE.GHVT01048939.1~~GHVT01048939.1.p1  ORF type:complete len:896 (+),score=194.98 GHVT01048939.1:78-2690(+)
MAPTACEDFAKELTAGGAFCLLNRLDADDVLLLKGSVHHYELLNEIPRLPTTSFSSSSPTSLNFEGCATTSSGNCGVSASSSPSSSSSSTSCCSSSPFSYSRPPCSFFSPSASCRQLDSISLLPFAQIRERGFHVRHEGEKIITLAISSVRTLQGDVAAALLPDDAIALYEQDQQPLKRPVNESASAAAAGPTTTETTKKIKCDKDKSVGRGPSLEASKKAETDKNICFTPDDEAYQAIVTAVFNREIAAGEGSSFVTPRTCKGRIQNFDMCKALAIFKNFLLNEVGTYWKFLLFDGSNFFIGATPERHLSVDGDGVRMNPISGTWRKQPPPGKAEGNLLQGLHHFLQDQKEVDELFMVTDEELRMMCRICPEGGRILGPFLKEMRYVVHTEYELVGERGEKDVIDCLRSSMFAPTVTGSPMGNACERLAFYEPRSRGYYSSAIVLMGRERGASGQVEEFLDSAITIRMHELTSDGSFQFRVGATLVKDSVPSEEVKETRGKALGALRALSGPGGGGDAVPLLSPSLAKDDAQLQVLAELLRKRNEGISRFWLNQFLPKPTSLGPSLTRRALLMNNDDDFVYMLQHLLYRVGFTCQVAHWKDIGDALESVGSGPSAASPFDLVVIGPGPGDPRDASEKTQAIQTVVRGLLRQYPAVRTELASSSNAVSTPSPSSSPSSSSSSSCSLGVDCALPGAAASVAPAVFRLPGCSACVRYLCVCLGHQNLCSALGYPLAQKRRPLQGQQVALNLFGTPRVVGCYNSFVPLVAAGRAADAAAFALRSADPHFPLEGSVEIAARPPADGPVTQADALTENKGQAELMTPPAAETQLRELIALRHEAVCSFQFHPESILTQDGVEILREAVEHLFPNT